MEGRPRFAVVAIDGHINGPLFVEFNILHLWFPQHACEGTVRACYLAHDLEVKPLI
jgi:hypothetical protein